MGVLPSSEPRTRPDALSRLADLGTISLTSGESTWLESRCPFFRPAYLDYLSAFRFKPEEQVSIEFVVEEADAEGVEWGRFEIEIQGGWAATILYEVSFFAVGRGAGKELISAGNQVPLMSIISEAYFTIVDLAWDYRGQFGMCSQLPIPLDTRSHASDLCPFTEQAKAKGKELFLAGCITSEFGSRRRRTYLAHDIIIRGLIAANDEWGTGEGRGKLAGTSNVHFAQKYDLAPM